MSNIPLVGREEEKKVLLQAMKSSKPELIAIYGRIRVGKTFLVRNTYKSKLNFEIAGIQDGSLKEQLQNFSYRLAEYSNSRVAPVTPANWIEAFHLLSKYLTRRKVKKHAIFIDELPWIATPRSGFLKAFDNFWNGWATKKNIVVVICGSAASWMIKKVIYNKGGLHNRVTHVINLHPFTLTETASFFNKKKISLNRYQILQVYMAVGGIPLYLDKIEAGKSAAQNIDSLCFSSKGFLRDEFAKLYSSLFTNPESHIKITRAISSKWKGLTRDEIIRQSKLSDGGSINRVLDELVYAGFISTYLPFDKKKKDKLYRLTDEYSLFYLKFIEDSPSSKNTWIKLSQSQKWKSWSGYAFESICIKHGELIKKALGIEAVYTEYSSFLIKGNKSKKGVQIDLIIDRNDNSINICEMKFYNGKFSITKKYAAELRQKQIRFQEKTKTTKQIFISMISSFGIEHNKNSLGLINHDLTIDVLFK